MHRSRVETLHIIKGDRRVNEKAEQPGTHQVPEPYGDKEVDRPLVGLHPRPHSAESEVAVRLEADQH